jgi:ribonuclease BN (tRNA processing enzyme)
VTGGEHASDDVRLILIGAGTPTPSPTRFGSAQVLVVGDDQLMFDCGPAATHKLVQAGLWPTQISHLFFTHHHFDHDVDYPCLLLCRWDQGAGLERRLEVYGPAPTEGLTAKLIGAGGAFEHDWRARINFPGSQQVFVNRGGTLPRLPPEVAARDIAPGWTLDGPGWRVTTALAEHVQPWLDSVAYRVDAPDLSVVFTGDTQPCASVLELAAGADVLVSMCWDDDASMAANGEHRGQTGTRSAARMAADAGVRQLVLTHMGRHVASPEVLGRELEAMAGIFSGRITVGEELMDVDLVRQADQEAGSAARG